MSDSQNVWLAFRNSDEGPPEYLGLAATPEGAQRICVADHDGSVETAEHIDAYREAHGQAREPKRETSIIWVASDDGSFDTSDESVFAFPGDQGYSILRDTVAP